MKAKTFYRKYDINYIGLSIGKHSYTYHIDSDFMSFFPESLFQDLAIDLELDFDKQSQNLFLLNFQFKGFYYLSCDRCLDKLNYPVDYEHRMIVKIEDGKEAENVDEDIIFLTSGDFRINVVDPVYQILNTQLPLRISCDMVKKQCNKAYIEKIDKLQDTGASAEIDARWEKLKNIK